MQLKLPDNISQIITKFIDHDYQIYLVGGAVRDLMLGQTLKDYDFTTDATPEQILELLPEGYNNNQFGTVGLNVQSDIQQVKHSDVSGEAAQSKSSTSPSTTSVTHTIEITTMRTEGEYHDARHPDSVNWTNKIEDDLQRRDFTINAMAINLANHQIVDPFDGQVDLEHKLIRAVGDPHKRFKEDALRLLRAVRFSCQLEFQIEPATFKSLTKHAELLEKISWERIRDELFKILATNHPYEGIMLLHETGLMRYIMPELERCFGVVQEGPKHDRVYDIGEHSLLSLKFCPSPDPLIRFAALIHDIGKPDTFKIDKTNNVTFYNHEVVGAKIAKQICERLRLSNKQTDKVVTLVRWHLFTVDENQTDSAIRRFIRHVGPENTADMMAIREADRLGGGTQQPTSWRLERFKERIIEVQHQPFSIKDLKINGTDVMTELNLPPSRQIGEILEQIFTEVEAEPTKNTREHLLARLKDFKP